MKEQQKEIIQNYVTSYNNFDIGGMIKDLDENVVFENVSGGEVELRTEGLTEFINLAESSLKYFKHRKQTIQSWQYNNSVVSIHIDYEAVLQTDLPNGMKSGDTLKLQGKSRFEFNKVKIIKISDEI